MTTANHATLFLVCKLGHTCARRGPCIWDPTGRGSVWVGWGCVWSVSLQVLTRMWSHGSWHFMAFPMWSTSSTRQKAHQLPVFSSGFFRELSAPSKCYLGTKLDTRSSYSEQKHSGYHFAIEFLLSLLSTTSLPWGCPLQKQLGLGLLVNVSSNTGLPRWQGACCMIHQLQDLNHPQKLGIESPKSQRLNELSCITNPLGVLTLLLSSNCSFFFSCAMVKSRFRNPSNA